MSKSNSISIPPRYSIKHTLLWFKSSLFYNFVLESYFKIKFIVWEFLRGYSFLWYRQYNTVVQEINVAVKSTWVWIPLIKCANLCWEVNSPLHVSVLFYKTATIIAVTQCTNPRCIRAEAQRISELSEVSCTTAWSQLYTSSPFIVTF